MSVHEHNRKAWNALVGQRQRHTTPARDEEYQRPLASLDSRGWFGADVRGKRVLCLAAGGGRQGPLFAAAGAIVTIVDLSSAMLEHDRQVAAERGLEVRLVETSMDDLSGLATGQFDIVWQPVSSCYVPDVVAVYREVARVTAIGGVYVSQHKQPASLQADVPPSPRGYELVEPYYRAGPLPPVADSVHREAGTLEFLHRFEELLGGMCRSGFVIEDLAEPLHAKPDAQRGSFAYRSRYAPPYVRIKARRVDRQVPVAAPPKVWLP